MNQIRCRLLALTLSLTLFLSLCSMGANVAQAADSSAGVPVAENLSLSTYRDVAVSGQLSAVDPEGDLLTYQLTSQPNRGKVTLSDESTGVFLYTPYDNKTGSDSFTYVAVDRQGNTSRAATVSIRISRSRSAVHYADMEENGAAACAQRLAEESVFIGTQVGSNWYFQPENLVSRSEFLAMAMTALNCEHLSSVSVTGFADDDGIETWAKTYAAAALRDGYVSGMPTENGLSFCGQDSITAAQAAVILNNILSLTDASAETFADGVETGPAWASQAVVNLISCGIPCQEPDTVLTRQDAAEMLCGAMDVVQARSSRHWLWF